MNTKIEKEPTEYTINEEQRLAELKNKTIVPVSSGEELVNFIKYSCKKFYQNCFSLDKDIEKG